MGIRANIMNKLKGLSELEIRFLSWAQNKGKVVVSTRDVINVLGINAKQEAKMFYSLSKKGIIAKVTRGFYLVPSMLPPGGTWSPSQYVVLYELMNKINATYQVTGMQAFNSYGLDTQVPVRIDVYNDKLSGDKKLAGLSFRFFKVDCKRLGFTQNINIKTGNITDNKTVVVFSSLPRTVFDAIYDYDRFGTLPIAYQWLTSRIQDKSFMKEFKTICLKLGNVGTFRRIGYILDKAKYKGRLVSDLKSQLKSTSSVIPLDPNRPCRSKGKISRKWGIADNEV